MKNEKNNILKFIESACSDHDGWKDKYTSVGIEKSVEFIRRYFDLCIEIGLTMGEERFLRTQAADYILNMSLISKER